MKVERVVLDETIDIKSGQQFLFSANSLKRWKRAGGKGKKDHDLASNRSSCSPRATGYGR